MLAACSPFLKLMFQELEDSCGVKDDNATLCLPGTTAKLVKPLLDYIYTGQVILPGKSVPKLLELAHRLGVK